MFSTFPCIYIGRPVAPHSEHASAIHGTVFGTQSAEAEGVIGRVATGEKFQYGHCVMGSPGLAPLFLALISCGMAGLNTNPEAKPSIIPGTFFRNSFQVTRKSTALQFHIHAAA